MQVLLEQRLKNLLPLMGRALLAEIFLLSAFSKIMDPSRAMGYMTAQGMPYTQFFLACAIGLETIGGLALLIGYKARWGAILLMGFLVPTTLIFHTNFVDPLQLVMYQKNLAILGGLLYAAIFGPGPLSIDARQKKIN